MCKLAHTAAPAVRTTWVIIGASQWALLGKHCPGLSFSTGTDPFEAGETNTHLKAPPADRGGVPLGKLALSQQLQTVSGNSTLTQGQQRKADPFLKEGETHLYAAIYSVQTEISNLWDSEYLSPLHFYPPCCPALTKKEKKKKSLLYWQSITNPYCTGRALPGEEM